MWTLWPFCSSTDTSLSEPAVLVLDQNIMGLTSLLIYISDSWSSSLKFSGSPSLAYLVWQVILASTDQNIDQLGEVLTRLSNHRSSVLLKVSQIVTLKNFWPQTASESSHAVRWFPPIHSCYGNQITFSCPVVIMLWLTSRTFLCPLVPGFIL